jgi:hypothetical protein
MDGNLWAGPNLVPGDPNPMNSNGKIFNAFLAKYPHLTVVNSMDICEGIITRKRITKNKTEKSVLDFIIVCDKLLPHLKKMSVDEERKFPMTSFSRVKGVSVAKDSDHCPLFVELNITFDIKRKPRK